MVDITSVPPPVVSMRLVSEPASTATDLGRSVGAAALLRGQFLAPRRPRVPRQCHIRISSLSLIKPFSRQFSHLCISARIRGEKVRSLLVSGSIPVPNLSEPIPLDLWFSLSYMHRLKGPTNVLQIAIHRCKEDGRSSHLQCRVDLSMDYILQKPLQKSTQLQLYAGKQCIATLEAMIWTSRPVSESLEHKADSANEGHIDANLDDPSSPSVSSAVSDATDISVEPEHSPDLNDESKNPSNALLRLRPALYSKMKLVRQSGSKMIDRLKHNLRRRSISTSDEEITNPEDRRALPCDLEFPAEAELYHERGLPLADDTDLLMAKFADVPTQIETVTSSFTNDPSSLPNTIMFVDRNCDQSRQVLEWSNRASTKSVLSIHRMVFFGDCHEAELLFFGITSLYKQIWQSSSSLGDQLRIGIAGDDASVTMILRPFVQLMARDPRSWLGLKFYIIPLNPHSSEHHISEKIALLDPQYRVLFRSSAWENAFDGKTALIEPVGRQIEESISHFLLKADCVFRLPIAEVMIEVVDDDPEVNGTTVSIPIIRDFSIIDIDYGSSEFQQQHLANALFPVLKAPKPLVIEYWAVDKRASKVSKFTLKTMFSTTRIFRLDSLASKQSREMQLDHTYTNAGSEADPPSEITAAINSVHQSVSTVPTLPDESLYMLIRLMPKDKNKFLQRFGAYSPKKSSGQSSHYERNEMITKFVCSAPHDVKFTACLDGLAISGCKFASLTPLWPTRTKSFPIALFKN